MIRRIQMKRLLSAAAAVCIAAMTAGCEKKTDVPAGNKDVGQPQQVGTHCTLEYFGFDVENSFEVKDVSSMDGVISMYFLELSGSEAQISVYESESNLAPAPYMDSVAEMYSDEELYEFSDWETIKSGELTVTVFRCECVGTEQEISQYYVFSQNRVLTIDEVYPLTDRDKLAESTDKLLGTVEYISDFKLPESAWTEETDKFTVTAEPLWYAAFNETEDDLCYIGVKYTQAETEERTFVWVEFEAYYGKEFSTPEEYLDNIFLGAENRVRRSTGKFRSYDAEIAEYSEDGCISRITSFKDGGVIYVVWTCQTEGDEKASSDIDKLIEGFAVKGE